MRTQRKVSSDICKNPPPGTCVFLWYFFIFRRDVSVGQGYRVSGRESDQIVD
jgi:hypothetical protein